MAAVANACQGECMPTLMAGAMRPIACVSIAGFAGIVVSQPLDVVRIKMQTTMRRARSGPGVFSCISGVLASQGVRGLYKGITTPLVTVGARNALLFLGYDFALKSMGTDSSKARFPELLVAGICSGLVAVPITSPSELVKLRVQVAASSEREILRSIWHKEGLRGLACGVQLTAGREVVYRSVYFALYETLARWMTGDREQRPAWVSLCAGSVAGVAPWAISYPIDVVKTHWQSNQRFGATTITGMFRNGLRTEGPQWLGRGLAPTLMRAAIMNATVWSVYEQLRGLIST